MDGDLNVHFAGQGDTAQAVHPGQPRLEIGQAVEIIDGETGRVAYALYVEDVEYNPEVDMTYYVFGPEQFSPPDLNDLFDKRTIATAFEDDDDEPLGI